MKKKKKISAIDKVPPIVKIKKGTMKFNQDSFDRFVHMMSLNNLHLGVDY